MYNETLKIKWKAKVRFETHNSRHQANNKQHIAYIYLLNIALINNFLKNKNKQVICSYAIILKIWFLLTLVSIPKYAQEVGTTYLNQYTCYSLMENRFVGWLIGLFKDYVLYNTILRMSNIQPCQLYLRTKYPRINMRMHQTEQYKNTQNLVKKVRLMATFKRR